MRLVKNKKVVKFPRAVSSVRKVLSKASNFCEKNTVDKVIVICAGENGTTSFYSKQTNAQSVYLLEQVKFMIYTKG